MGKFCSLCGGKVGETCACGEGEPPAPQPQNQQDAAPDQQPVPFPGIPQPGVAPMWPPGYPVPHMGMQPPSHPATGLQCYICGVVCANKTVLGMHINECYKKHGEGRGAQHPMDVVMEGYTLFLNQKQAAHDAPPDAAVPNGAGLVAARMLQPPMYPMPGYAIPGLPSGHAYPMPHPVMLPGQFPGYAGGPYGMPMCYPQVPANPQPQAAPGPALAGEVERLTRELESLRQGKEEEYVQKQKQRTEAQVREGAPEAERRRLEQMQRDVQRDMEALKRQQAVQQAQEETARPAQPAQPTPPPRAPSPAHAPHRGYSEAPPPAAGDVSSASASSPAPVPVPVVPVRRFEEKSARPLSARSGDAQPGSAPPPAMPRRASSGGVKGVQNLKELLKQGSAGAPGPGVSAPTGPAEGKEMPGGKIQCTRCGREFGKKAFAVHAQGCGIDLRSRMSEKEGEEYDRQHNPDAEENKELSKQQIVKKRLAEEQAWQQFMVTYPRNVVQEEPLTQAERSNLKPNNPKGNGVECSRCGVTVPLAELDRHEAGCQGKKKPGAAPQAPPEALLPCAHCGRTFSPAALDRHESACQRQQAKKKAKRPRGGARPTAGVMVLLRILGCGSLVSGLRYEGQSLVWPVNDYTPISNSIEDLRDILRAGFRGAIESVGPGTLPAGWTLHTVVDQADGKPSKGTALRLDWTAQEHSELRGRVWIEKPASAEPDPVDRGPASALSAVTDPVQTSPGFPKRRTVSVVENREPLHETPRGQQITSILKPSLSSSLLPSPHSPQQSFTHQPPSVDMQRSYDAQPQVTPQPSGGEGAQGLTDDDSPGLRLHMDVDLSPVERVLARQQRYRARRKAAAAPSESSDDISDTDNSNATPELLPAMPPPARAPPTLNLTDLTPRRQEADPAASPRATGGGYALPDRRAPSSTFSMLQPQTSSSAYHPISTPPTHAATQETDTVPVYIQHPSLVPSYQPPAGVHTPYVLHGNALLRVLEESPHRVTATATPPTQEASGASRITSPPSAPSRQEPETPSTSIWKHNSVMTTSSINASSQNGVNNASSQGDTNMGSEKQLGKSSRASFMRDDSVVLDHDTLVEDSFFLNTEKRYRTLSHVKAANTGPRSQMNSVKSLQSVCEDPVASSPSHAGNTSAHSPLSDVQRMVSTASGVRTAAHSRVTELSGIRRGPSAASQVHSNAPQSQADDALQCTEEGSTLPATSSRAVSAAKPASTAGSRALQSMAEHLSAADSSTAMDIGLIQSEAALSRASDAQRVASLASATLSAQRHSSANPETRVHSQVLSRVTSHGLVPGGASIEQSMLSDVESLQSARTASSAASQGGFPPSGERDLPVAHTAGALLEALLADPEISRDLQAHRDGTGTIDPAAARHVSDRILQRLTEGLKEEQKADVLRMLSMYLRGSHPQSAPAAESSPPQHTPQPAAPEAGAVWDAPPLRKPVAQYIPPVPQPLDIPPWRRGLRAPVPLGAAAVDPRRVLDPVFSDAVSTAHVPAPPQQIEPPRRTPATFVWQNGLPPPQAPAPPSVNRPGAVFAPGYDPHDVALPPAASAAPTPHRASATTTQQLQNDIKSLFATLDPSLGTPAPTPAAASPPPPPVQAVQVNVRCGQRTATASMAVPYPLARGVVDYTSSHPPLPPSEYDSDEECEPIVGSFSNVSSP